MLISELKEEIKKYNQKDLESIIVELYKRIPKNKKEDYNIDDFIKNVDNKQKINSKKEFNFEELEKEIKYFLSCVDNEYYVVPNKIVSKKERSSWRFKVKRYYKELSNIIPNSDNGAQATMLLIEIFKRLSIGSNRLLFINWETFRALGVSQSDYYDNILKRILYNGYTKENLQKCIDFLDIVKDPYELSYDMFYTYISNLKTIDNKEVSIQLINEKIEDLKLKFKNEKNSGKQFDLQELLNEYVECVTDIYFELEEIEKGIKFFHKNYIERSKEIKEYVLLNKLDVADLIDAWLKEYEQNMNKINFRESLKKRYEELIMLSKK